MAGGYDISKFPKKYITSFLILGAIASCFTLFSFMYMNAGPHFIPDFFAIDNEQRVYLSFESGVYVVEDNRFYPVLSETTQSPTISITDRDILYIANVGEYTAIDLNSSVPKNGNIQSKIVSAEAVQGYFHQSGIKSIEMDEQNGIHYRYEKGLFWYEIVQETNHGDRILFQMPQSEYELNLFISIGAILIALCVVIYVLITYSYAVKHPETITEYLLFRKKDA
jgi:multisubunit Na+/H+ antiporter MnhB subunit